MGGPRRDERSQRWRVGATTVTSIVEREDVGVPAALLLPDATPEEVQQHEWARGVYTGDDGSIGLRVQAFVVDHGGRTILVDPCVGNGKKRFFPLWSEQSLPWLERFVAAGFAPDEVDLVVHTHLHADHVGWDTVAVEGGWAPTFPRARHLYVDAELEHWRAPEQRTREDVYADSVAPIVEAGLADVVGPDTDLGDGLRLVPAPGHTPGQVALAIGDGAVISGDLVHHPVQLSRPDWREIADGDPDLARQTRRAFFEEHQDSGALVFGTHFPAHPAGRVVAASGAWRFEPVAGSYL